MNKKIGALCVLLAGCLWGCTGISVRALTAAGLSSFNISFFRSFLAFCLFSVYLRITPQTLLFGLGAGLSYALYSIFSRFALSRGYSSETVSVYTFFFSSLTLLPFSDLPAAFSALSKGTPIVFLFVLSVFSTLAPYLLYTLSLTVVENGKAAVLAATEPVTAALVGVLFLGDPLPDLPAIFGMLMVLGAILLCNLTFTRRKKDERL